jgi:endoglucanase
MSRFASFALVQFALCLPLAACSGGAQRESDDDPVQGARDAATGDGATAPDGSYPARDGAVGPDGGPLPSADGGAGDAGVYDPELKRFPLRTRGRYVVDALGARVKLASVNWYGASDTKLVAGGLDTAKLADIVQTIKNLGFNSVRLPFANLILHDQAVDPANVKANPELVGLNALEVYDRTVEALTRAGLLVLLNNHTTHPMWCCNLDTDGLWYTPDYSEQQWIDDWVMMAKRYRHNPRVIAADLRNEVRPRTVNGLPDLAFPTWAGATNDWRAAAERAGAKVLEANPDLLVVVEGVNFPRIHLQGVGADPIRLPLPNRLIYAAHNYGYIGPGLDNKPSYESMDWPTFKAQMDKEWGYVIRENKAWTGPVWVSEFGTGHDSSAWWDNIVRYLREGDFDFAYWAVNPGPKASGDDEPFGLLEKDWVTPLDDFRTQSLKSIAAPTEGPGIEPEYESDPAHHLSVLLFSDWDTQATEPAVDWQSNTYKATCAEGARLAGASTIRRATQLLGHTALCSATGLPAGNGVRTLVANNEFDSPDATAHTGGSDWAGTFTKLACPVGQMAVGVSQSRGVTYRIAGLLCEGRGASTVGECNAVAFDSQNERRSELGGDWDESGLKGQCALDEFVAGISLSAGTPHSLLCCKAQ